MYIKRMYTRVHRGRRKSDVSVGSHTGRAIVDAGLLFYLARSFAGSCGCALARFSVAYPTMRALFFPLKHTNIGICRVIRARRGKEFAGVSRACTNEYSLHGRARMVFRE